MESPESISPSAIVIDETLFIRETDYTETQKRNRALRGIQSHVLEEYANETFQRYEESNQRIDSFYLRLKTESYARFGIATEWTLNALKLGATDLTFRSRLHNIVIPLNQAVFGNEKVFRLRLERSNITRLKVTEWPSLKSLSLSEVTMQLDPFFDIISCCPSVESLSLFGIYREFKYNYNTHEYEHVDTSVKHATPPVLILHQLTSLVLRCVDSLFQIKTLFLDDLSSKFPNLKHLTLELKHDSFSPALEVVSISSASLETLNIVEDLYGDRCEPEEVATRGPRVEFDVPSIRKVTIEGMYIPSVSFRSISEYPQWEESHVTFTKRVGNISTAWFRELRELLTNLKGSKIHLCLHMHFWEGFDYEVGKLDGLNVCEVEDLTLDIKEIPSLNCHALLDGLFRICRPKMIVPYETPPGQSNGCCYARRPCVHYRGDIRKYKDLYICRVLERAMQMKSFLIPSQFMYGLRDLEEVDAQELVDGVWRPQPLGSILDGSTVNRGIIGFGCLNITTKKPEGIPTEFLYSLHP